MARILIIDDEEVALFTLREILETEGHRVIQATNGNMGINKQRARPCDLVITDIIMPEKGVETTIELKRNFQPQDHRHLRRRAYPEHGLFEDGRKIRRREDIIKPFSQRTFERR